MTSLSQYTDIFKAHRSAIDAHSAPVLNAARDAHRQVRIVEERTQGKDHPILLGAPETRYLKFFVLQVY